MRASVDTRKDTKSITINKTDLESLKQSQQGEDYEEIKNKDFEDFLSPQIKNMIEKLGYQSEQMQKIHNPFKQSKRVFKINNSRCVY